MLPRDLRPRPADQVGEPKIALYFTNNTISLH
jgi:hypothetical protein